MGPMSFLRSSRAVAPTVLANPCTGSGARLARPDEWGQVSAAYRATSCGNFGDAASFREGMGTAAITGRLPPYANGRAGPRFLPARQDSRRAATFPGCRSRLPQGTTPQAPAGPPFPTLATVLPR